MTGTATAGAPAILPPAVRALVAARGLGDAPVRFAAASATRIDTGGWLGGERLWVAVVGERFVLAAAGPRPYVLDLPIKSLSNAVYNHVTGTVVFPRGTTGSDIPPVRLDPLVARSLFALAAGTPPTSPGTVTHA